MARALIRADDGTEKDVTEGIQAMYDLIIESMDWGSGFLSFEDAVPMAVVARALGFKRCDEVERYLLEHQRMEGRLPRRDGSWEPVPHDHLFSAKGACMWPRCKVEASDAES